MTKAESILKQHIVGEWMGTTSHYIDPLHIPKIICAMEEYAQIKVNELNKSGAENYPCKICNDSGWINSLERCSCVRHWDR